MKNIKTISIFILILALFTWYEISRYTWYENTKKYTFNSNTIIIDSTDQLTLLKPWTWFYQPRVSFEITEKGQFGRFNKQYYFADVKTYRCNEQPLESVYIIDMSNNWFTIMARDSFLSLKGLNEVKTLDFNKIPSLFYTDNDALHIRNIKDFLLKNVKEYIAIDYLGNSHDISNYVASGQYTPLKNKNIVFNAKFINNSPIKLTTPNINLLHSKIKEYCSENFNSKNYNIKDIKYSYSIEIQAKMYDIYSLSIVDQSNKFNEKLYFEICNSENVRIDTDSIH
jgi:hypothetical protein